MTSLFEHHHSVAMVSTFFLFLVTGTTRVCRAYGRRCSELLRGRVPRFGGGARAIMPIFFTHPLRHVSNHLHTMLPPPRRRPTHHPGLKLRTFNIQDGWVFVLPQVIQAVQLVNYNMMLLTETNIPDKAYFHNYLGCNFVFFQAVGTMAGGGYQRVK